MFAETRASDALVQPPWAGRRAQLLRPSATACAVIEEAREVRPVEQVEDVDTQLQSPAAPMGSSRESPRSNCANPEVRSLLQLTPAGRSLKMVSPLLSNPVVTLRADHSRGRGPAPDPPVGHTNHAVDGEDVPPIVQAPPELRLAVAHRRRES